MKPTTTEDQHVRAYELGRRTERIEAERKMAEDAKKHRLKALHWMRCPKCGQELTTDSRGPVEIDLCPDCHGVWLDANELETILASESRRGLFRSCLTLLGAGPRH